MEFETFELSNVIKMAVLGGVGQKMTSLNTETDCAVELGLLKEMVCGVDTCTTHVLLRMESLRGDATLFKNFFIFQSTLVKFVQLM